MNRFIRTIDRLNDSVGRAVSWLALLLVVVGAWNAVSRYLDREAGTTLSSNFWIEAGWYLFAALFLFGAAWALRNDAHVRVDVFYSRLSNRGKAWVDLLGTLLLLIPFAVLMLWAVWPSVEESWRIKEMSPDPGGLPRWPVRAVVPIAFILLLLQGIANGLKALNVLKGEEIVLEGEEKNG
ncbi:MAG: TRAP transporter small permease subunit [Candidatus Kapaibacterium sp.]